LLPWRPSLLQRFGHPKSRGRLSENSDVRYRLRTLLIATAIGPPLLAVAWWFNLFPIVAAMLIYAICLALVDPKFVAYIDRT
jgi:uncharacterized membrane protein YccC